MKIKLLTVIVILIIHFNLFAALPFAVYTAISQYDVHYVMSSDGFLRIIEIPGDLFTHVRTAANWGGDRRSVRLVVPHMGAVIFINRDYEPTSILNLIEPTGCS